MCLVWLSSLAAHEEKWLLVIHVFVPFCPLPYALPALRWRVLAAPRCPITRFAHRTCLLHRGAVLEPNTHLRPQSPTCGDDMCWISSSNTRDPSSIGRVTRRWGPTDSKIQFSQAHLCQLGAGVLESCIDSSTLQPLGKQWEAWNYTGRRTLRPS